MTGNNIKAQWINNYQKVDIAYATKTALVDGATTEEIRSWYQEEVGK